MRLTRLGVILITVFAMQGVTGSPGLPEPGTARVGLRPEGHARLADAAYAEKIKAYTTGERFLSDVVGYRVPCSESQASSL